MKYSAVFGIENGLQFVVESTEDYIPNELDLISGESLFSEPAIYKYLTKSLLEKYRYKSVNEYVRSFLSVTKERWNDREEFRFFIRDCANSKLVGITGVDVKDPQNGVGETWSLKSTSVPPLMFAVKKIAIQFMKSEGLKILVGNVKKDNITSQKMLERLGYVSLPKAMQKEYVGIKTLEDELRYVLTL